MVLMVKPNHFKVKIATISEMGIASKEIRVALQFIRKRKSITTTKKLPSSNVF